MSKRQQIRHEANGAAYELAHRGTDEVVAAGGRITIPAIYSTVPGPHRAAPTHFVERLSMERGVWALDKAYNKTPLALCIRAMRQYAWCRAVVIDHAGARHVLGPKATVAKNVKPGDPLHVTKAGNVQRATPAKVQRTVAHKLVLADLMAATPKPKAQRVPKPRRGPAKPRSKAPPVRVERENVPMLVPIADVVAEELAHAQFRKVRLGAVGLAMIASLKKQQRGSVTR